jgi:hypothetical protein
MQQAAVAVVLLMELIITPVALVEAAMLAITMAVMAADLMHKHLQQTEVQVVAVAE